MLTGLLAAAEEPVLKSGLDPSTFDRSVRPQDDLYRFVNGRWLDTTVIPADRVTYGTFAELADRAEHDVRRIIEQLDGRNQPQRQIRDLYASMMNEARVEALGDAPIRDELRRIEAVDSPRRWPGRSDGSRPGMPEGRSPPLSASTPATPACSSSRSARAAR